LKVLLFFSFFSKISWIYTPFFKSQILPKKILSPCNESHQNEITHVHSN
jgi:hypothetical protein